MAYAALSRQISVHEIATNVYESVIPPTRMGNSLPIAYGGNTIGVALSAAIKTAPSAHRVYSATGIFLGPARTDRPLRCRVVKIRDTRSFTTRRVTVEQKLDDGSSRACLEVTVDFQADEPVSVMTYSAATTYDYGGLDRALTAEAAFKALLDKGQIKPGLEAKISATFGAGHAVFDSRQCIDGVGGQNLGGFAKHVRTTMDNRPITERASAEWIRTRDVLDESDQVPALGYMMDGALSFTPLVHEHMFLEDVGACSSLDFALRIFTREISLDQWHIRERKTIAADAGRTYSEGRLWDANGKMVASMTQQSIMRPKPQQSKPPSGRASL